MAAISAESKKINEFIKSNSASKSDREMASILNMKSDAVANRRKKMGISRSRVLSTTSIENARDTILQFGKTKTVDEMAVIAGCRPHLIVRQKIILNAIRLRETDEAIRAAILDLPFIYTAAMICAHLKESGTETSLTKVQEVRKKMIDDGEHSLEYASSQVGKNGTANNGKMQELTVCTYNSSAWNPSHDMIKMSTTAKKALVAARFF